jgi:hypothetical protein
MCSAAKDTIKPADNYSTFAFRKAADAVNTM